MKVILLLTILSISAFATEIHLKSFTERRDHSYEPEFKINKELERAWVNVVHIDDSDWEESYDYDNFVKVEGLKLEGSNIVYNDTVCATVQTRGWRIFRHEVIVMTDNCQFTQKRETIQYDDGFYVHSRKKIRVYLVINE